jgi:tryptophanyl-tRNA synthetase
MKRILTGIKPTSDMMHIGNYFGMTKPMLDFQNDPDTFLIAFIADLHALITIHDGEKLRDNIFKIACNWLACGLDTDKTLLLKQSDIPEHLQLYWILNTLSSVSLLERAHAYKDAKNKEKTVSLGLFTYPILMAADILLYDATHVPVGKDQKQHIEMARDIAMQYNKTFSEQCIIPEPIIHKDTEIIPGLDGRKMSKSYNNYIGLFEDEKSIQKKIMSIKTDSIELGQPLNEKTCFVFSLYKKLAKHDDVEKLRFDYQNGNIGYGESKKRLIIAFFEYFGEIRKKYDSYVSQPDNIYEILNKSHKKIEPEVKGKMKKIYTDVGYI